MSTLSVNSIIDASGGNTASINGATPTNDNLMGRNKVINGAMEIAERGTSAVTASQSFPVDRFKIIHYIDGALSMQQDSSAPAGFISSAKFTTTTADTSLGTSQYVFFQQRIEGTNIADLAWGTASAKTVTLSFWVRSSLTGTFGGTLMNSGYTRSYPFSYTISAADTWEQKTITIAGETTGTWLTDTGIGIRLSFGLGVGSNYGGTAGAWASSELYAPTGATSVIGTLNATWYITGVQLEAGSVATSFERRPYGQELALCQRYLPVVLSGNGDVAGSGYCATTNTNFQIAIPFKVPARTAPTGLTASSAGHFYVQAHSGGLTVTNVTLGAGGVNGAYVTFAASAGTSGQGCFIQAISASANLYFNGCEL